ncbi:DUF2207 family protein [Evansella cellulosilytica]|uniref:Predicted membrane protein YciQ-like C-terminal domain-containing protein n=1 Tax=Evansella cellulosilytica (strain ATCC 21833 / DSM 2522 / FERM P-1141 / JCM 9156 / N-4) TaxID=649639 RepID=E6U244_EVAC2|nr:DUF2207 domain-containing protein [Evansella cellulosilytica]ADU30422.1 hypothetical protein Bcell_2161 [Evansella cellulosilytica DSM 2522]
MNAVFTYITLFIFCSVLCYTLMSHYRAKSKMIEFDIEKLENLSPTLAAYFFQNIGVSSRHLVASLLYLVKKEFIQLQFDEVRQEYYFCIGTNDPSFISNDDAYLIQWLFYDVGKNGVFYPSDLQSYTFDREGEAKFLESCKKWENLLKAQLETEGLISKKIPTKRWITGSFSFLFLILGSVYLFFVPLIGILYLSGSITLLLACAIMPLKTNKGWEITQQLSQYKLYLKNKAAVENNSWLTLNYIYAIAFGMKKDFSKQFPIYDASAIKIKQNSFPLYMTIAPGTYAIIKESIDAVDEIEAAFTQALQNDDIIIEEGYNESNIGDSV